MTTVVDELRTVWATSLCAAAFSRPRGSICPSRTQRPGESLGDALEVDAATLDEIISGARSSVPGHVAPGPPE